MGLVISGCAAAAVEEKGEVEEEEVEATPGEGEMRDEEAEIGGGGARTTNIGKFGEILPFSRARVSGIMTWYCTVVYYGYSTGYSIYTVQYAIMYFIIICTGQV